MAELGLGMLFYIGFYLVPVAPVIPYLLAPRTYRQEPAQYLYLGEGLLEFREKPLPFLFGPLAITDVPEKNKGALLVVIQDGHRGHLDVERCPVKPEIFLFDHGHSLAVHIKAPDAFPHDIEIIGMHAVQNGLAYHGGRRLRAEHPDRRVVYIGELAVCLNKDPVGRVLHEKAKTLLAFSQDLFGKLPLVYVRYEPLDTRGAVGERCHSGIHYCPEYSLILAVHPAFVIIDISLFLEQV